VLIFCQIANSNLPFIYREQHKVHLLFELVAIMKKGKPTNMVEKFPFNRDEPRTLYCMVSRGKHRDRVAKNTLAYQTGRKRKKR
jgi:hypothetical protein